MSKNNQHKTLDRFMMLSNIIIHTLRKVKLHKLFQLSHEIIVKHKIVKSQNQFIFIFHWEDDTNVTL